VFRRIRLVKGKAVPVRNSAPYHEDVGKSGGIASPFFTSALNGGRWSVSRPGCFTPREEHPAPIRYEAMWVPEPVSTLCSREKYLASTGNWTPAVQPVTLPYTDRATTAPRIKFVDYTNGMKRCVLGFSDTEHGCCIFFRLLSNGMVRRVVR
jgi:hypothetical protein